MLQQSKSIIVQTKSKMEKFDLKWNDFQTTISQYFKQLRDEKEFFDVTLVSEDNKLFQTHKIVLTACSSFFKPILANVHAHPLNREAIQKNE